MTSFHHRHSYATRFPRLAFPCAPTPVTAPQWLAFNHVLADELAWPADLRDSDAGLALFSGNQLPSWVKPHALAYAGHQFAQFVPQLGDGRAVLLGEVAQGEDWVDVQLKGSGRTPFSRGGDGRAALGPVLREYLVSEAMHGLGVPTTRALAAVVTGETVQRETALPGAILTRVAASHLRVGTAQYVLHLNQLELLQQFMDYVIERHYPSLIGFSKPYLKLLEHVQNRQAKLIAQWMSLGFIHGVMNTDNMTLSGETIDYGPCAFMEAYDPTTSFSFIDKRGRYAYHNQPAIGLWNMARFAETLLPLLGDEAASVRQATAVLEDFQTTYEKHYWQFMCTKIGLPATPSAQQLVQRYLNLMHAHQVDFTLAFRVLADGDASRAKILFNDQEDWRLWYHDWQQVVSPATVAQLRHINPAYIPRNHLVARAITEAEQTGDLTYFNRLQQILAEPFTERPQWQEELQPASPEQQVTQTFCGT